VAWYLVLPPVALGCMYFAYGVGAGYIQPFGVALATPWNLVVALLPIAAFVVLARAWRVHNANRPKRSGC
jgi:hypothetical protein